MPIRNSYRTPTGYPNKAFNVSRKKGQVICNTEKHDLSLLIKHGT